MANKEKLPVLPPLPESSLPSFSLLGSKPSQIPTITKNSIFEVPNSFPIQGSLALNPEKSVSTVNNDDDFDAEVVSFEEKSKIVSNLTTKQERILEGKGKVISFFKEAVDYKLKNLDDFRTLAEQAAVMARLSVAACAPGDGHGVQNNTSPLSPNVELSLNTNIPSIFSKDSHKEGRHDHCRKCGEDLNEGKCKKCAA